MPSLNRVLIRLSRWPRRVAALSCLLLAAASAVSPANGSDPPRSPRTANPIAAGLADGQVAVPVRASSVPSADLVRVGDRVGLLTGTDDGGEPATLVADRLRVLAVSSGQDLSTAEPVVVVAANRDQAVRIATSGTRPLLIVVDRFP